MTEVLEKYLRSSVVISDEDIATILAFGTIKKLRKSQSILHDGEVWRKMCFILSGCCRLYRCDKNGDEHTVRFGIENWWMTDQESFNNETPSHYNVEALTASSVIVWEKSDWKKLLETIPAFKQFYDMLIARAYETSLQRIYLLISSSPEKRYVEFQKTYPNVFNKVPLHMVASYLGISRKTMSRVRNEFARPHNSSSE